MFCDRIAQGPKKRTGFLVNLPFLLVIVLGNIFARLNAQKSPAQSAVTYNFAGVGRFGDQLIGYIKAHLISYVHGIPLLHKPMLYADQLVLSQEEQLYNELLEKNFSSVVRIKGSSGRIRIEYNKPILYEVSIHSSLTSVVNESKLKKYARSLVPVLNDEKYMQILRHKISVLPHVKLEEIYRPADQICVAVHVRTGGGFDWVSGDPQSEKKSNKKSCADKKWPSKFPPQEFYIKKIRELSTLFPGQPLYLHIFTDDQNPEQLVKGFQGELDGLPLTFATRYKDNAHDKNVLDDFFGMMKFDCLIRPWSSFSMAAEVLGHFKVVLYPGGTRVYKD